MPKKLKYVGLLAIVPLFTVGLTVNYVSNVYAENESTTSENKIAYVIIPNGNNLQGNTGLYIPQNLEIKSGTTVIWVNADNYGHTVQSQDQDGKPTGSFNSNVLKTGDTFTHKFNELGEYPYYCTLHPWRTGSVTVGN